jgi:hypothetical protein
MTVYIVNSRGRTPRRPAHLSPLVFRMLTSDWKEHNFNG